MLNVEILYKSQNTILELIQKDHFIVEHHNLKVQTPLSKRSRILPLAPTLLITLTLLKLVAVFCIQIFRINKSIKQF